jgi:hypothetical protein
LQSRSLDAALGYQYADKLPCPARIRREGAREVVTGHAEVWFPFAAFVVQTLSDRDLV